MSESSYLILALGKPMKATIKPRKKPLQNRSQAMVETIFQATARVLVKHGYDGTNTNLIAQTAGISVGSIYQYFPNKDALINALWARHGDQVHALIEDTIRNLPFGTLHDTVAALVRASMEMHQLEPELHRVLEQEFPFFGRSRKGKSAHDAIAKAAYQLLEKHRAEITEKDLNLATYMVMHMMESLVHAAVLDQPAQLALPDIENAIVNAVTGYLTFGTPSAAAKSPRRGRTPSSTEQN
jgi:AcrR family transcriptional regulator